jgi:hypothetical protein
LSAKNRQFLIEIFYSFKQVIFLSGFFPNKFGRAKKEQKNGKKPKMIKPE